MEDRVCRVAGPYGAELGEHIRPELIDAAVWREAVERSEQKLWTNGKNLTKGAVGLIVGHARIWERVAKQEFPWSVVMEDDLSWFNPKVAHFLCRLVKEGIGPLMDEKILKKKNWTRIFAKGGKWKRPTGVKGVKVQAKFDVAPNDALHWDLIQLQTWFPPNKRQLDEDLRVMGMMGTGAAMYIITRDAAEKALKGAFPITSAAAVQLDDRDGFLASKLHSFHVSPTAALQHGSNVDSDVQIEDGQGFTVVHSGNSLLDKGSRTLEIPSCSAMAESDMLQPALMHPNCSACHRMAAKGS